MLKKALPILFALATANSITAAYAEDLAERRQLARDYLAVVATEAKIMRSVEASRKSFYQLLQENQPALYAEKRTKIEAIINEMLQSFIKALAMYDQWRWIKALLLTMNEVLKDS